MYFASMPAKHYGILKMVTDETFFESKKKMFFEWGHKNVVVVVTLYSSGC